VAIEVTSGDVRKQLELLVRHMVAGGTFSENTNPTDSDLDTAISVAEADILTRLAGLGYDTVVTNWSNNAKNFFSWYNALCAAYRVEQAHQGLSAAPGIPTRSEGYYRQYMDLWTALNEGDLDLVGIGVPQSSANSIQPSLTGVSYTQKAELEDDPDAVLPFFDRTDFTHPERTRRNRLYADP
jgi:hypothetical protein